MPIPFDRYNYLKMKDLERCPYYPFCEEAAEWHRKDNYRMLLISLDRYAEEIRMKENEYRCAWCGGIFELVRDENWNQEKADEEYRKNFPGSSMKSRDVVCDDCWQVVKPNA